VISDALRMLHVADMVNDESDAVGSAFSPNMAIRRSSSAGRATPL
jgi:hypothetical protein